LRFLREFGHKMIQWNIPAEGFQAKLIGGKGHARSGEKIAGIINKGEFSQWLRQCCKTP
jgi:hypothetical protein